MKLRNIVLAIAAAAVAGVNVYNAVSGKQAKLSDLQMENVEMLAEAESAGGYYCRYNSYFGFCYSHNTGSACPSWAC